MWSGNISVQIVPSTFIINPKNQPSNYLNAKYAPSFCLLCPSQFLDQVGPRFFQLLPHTRNDISVQSDEKIHLGNFLTISIGAEGWGATSLLLQGRAKFLAKIFSSRLCVGNKRGI